MADLPAGQQMWICWGDTIDTVSVVEKGTGGRVFKRGHKPKKPYIVSDGEEQFVVSYDDLHDNPRDAHVAMLQLREQAGLQTNPVQAAPEPDEEDGPEDDEDEDEDEDEDDEDDEDEDEG